MDSTNHDTSHHHSTTWSEYAGHFCESESMGSILHSFSQWASEIILQENADVFEDIVFLDVACGWGYLSLEVLKRLKFNSAINRKQFSLLATDYAQGMVNSTESLLRCYCRENDLHLNLLECKVMDACEPNLPAESISHLGCMFGVMFFPQLDVALSSLRIALRTNGIAMFSSWQHSDTVQMALEFYQFLNPETHHDTDIESSLKKFTSICQSTDEFACKLELAGYREISTRTKEDYFLVPNTLHMIQALAENPVLGPCFDFESDEELMYHWHRFLSSQNGQHWLDENSGCVKIRMVANLAICRK